MMFDVCVELPTPMDHKELLVGDRTFLLYYIRGLTFGNLYKFVSKCPKCNAEGAHTYDMNELYGTKSSLSSNYNNIGFIYTRYKNPKKALPYLQKALKLTKQSFWDLSLQIFPMSSILIWQEILRIKP